jgi:hypothetical protein
MKARFNQVPLYLTLSLLAGLMGGCGESENANVQQSPQPTASQSFPSPSVPVTLNSPSNAALTRPTNPDDRLKVIKSGRNDPFGLLVAPQPSGGNVSTASTASNSSSPSTETTEPKVANGGKPSGSSKSTRNLISSLGNILKPGAAGKPSSMPGGGNFSLPELPAKPALASVKVTGVLQVAGVPRAIIQAPGEPTSRTVSIGDSLSNGQLYVKNIDMSNSAEPVVIFQQGDLEFSVAVGREPVLIASAGPSAKPARGLSLPKLRP